MPTTLSPDLLEKIPAALSPSLMEKMPAALLVDAKMPVPAAIGHRIVHGAPKLRQHCLIDDSVLAQLEAATAFAPLHIPSALSVIRFAQEHFPGFRRQRVSTRPFTPNCRRSHVSFQSPGNWNSRVSNVMGFTAFRANRLCSNSRTICRTVS
jgi:acetate kinase